MQFKHYDVRQWLSAFSVIILGAGLFLSSPARATGYYNFGSNWKGGMNPYRLGAEQSAQSGFSSGLGAPLSGAGDGMLKYPGGIVTDSSGNIYVSDANDRISKFDSSGVFQGWIGKIATSPTGGAAGCSGAAVGTATPGWCKGGTSTYGTGDGMIDTVYGMAIDSSGNLYLAESGNDRISKYNSSGVFQGWIGKIATSPTGGAAGCSGASGVTPGWCKGGTAGSGTGDGMLNSPQAIALDASGNLYVTDGNHRISKFNSSGVFQGWIGKIATSPTGGAAGCSGAAVGTATPGWCKGGTATYGIGDGMLHTPVGIAVDASGTIYVTDGDNYRLVKFNSTGVFQGWTGAVATTPTSGAAGCSTAAASSVTPGWCLGGTAQTGLATGAVSLLSRGLALDSAGNLYLSDFNAQRISKWDATTGAAIGWIGQINISPTGGDAGCSGASNGTITPGWCSGGNASSGDQDGAFNAPQAVTVDSSGNIYVADQNNNRINRYSSAGVASGALQSISKFYPWYRTSATPVEGNGDGALSVPAHAAIDSSKNLYVVDRGNDRINKYSSSGTFLGWIGEIKTSPTGGAAGCSGAAVGSNTPGWCTGGTSTYGSGDGGMYNPGGIAVDLSGTLYIVDTYHYRVQKFSAAGVFQGWIGNVNTPPTGGAAGCSATSAGSPTPGWCTGGDATSGAGDGALNSPTRIALDSAGNLYVTDTGNSRINKYTSTGAFAGWIGKIAVVPTGGAAGCSTAAVGTFTPGWCTGGKAVSGNGNGFLNGPDSIAIDSSDNIFVTDSNNHRINKYTSSGAFLGWTGIVGTTPSGGAAGCTSAGAGTHTPGWCTGGTGAAAGNTSLNTPQGIAIDGSGNLYIADNGNNRVVKYDALGAQKGWYGKIASSPTGGSAGCKGAAAGSVTLGWCTGGTSSSGSADGMMNSPAGLTLDSSGNLYIADRFNYRIIRISTAGK